MQRKRWFMIPLLIAGLMLSAAFVSAQDDEDGLPSPIPGAECMPDVEPSGDPIVVGGSLSLTGPFAPTANIHRVVGELYVDWVNECGGVLGRPLEFLLLDDQSSPEQVTANYERLTTVDNVDMLIGPYAGANILAGAGPAQRAGYVYVTHTNGVPDVDLGEYHFPSWQIGGGSEEAPWDIAANVVFDALESTENPPESVFYLTNKFPTTLAMTQGARAIGEERGYTTADYVEYDLGTADFSSVALRISAADPDFIYVGAIGLDGLNLYDAFETIGYIPRGIFVALPSPGPMMSLGEVAEGHMALSIFELHEPFTDDPVVVEFADRYQAAAEEEGLLTIVETQAAASMSAWQMITAAITATESLDQDEIQEWLKSNEFDVVAGAISFDGFNGFGTDFSRIVQVQNGERVIVWPPEFAPEGVSVAYPIE